MYAATSLEKRMNDMQLLVFILIVALLVGAAIVFTRYEPKLDLVKSRNKYIMLLWYNKYDWAGVYIARTYIKLFEV